MIKFENVHKYLGGFHVLRGVSFHIKRGETFVIVGPTGTGKSVTLRHIIGLHFADEGRVIVDDKDVAGLTSRELEAARVRIGFLFQDGALLNWLSVRDNVALPLKETTRMKRKEIYDKVEKTLALVGLSEDAEKMPADISGGMRKRAGLARAIITEPHIILYDEPTSGLDPVMSRKIDALISSLRDRLNITSVVVTHDLCSAFGVGDRIAMLSDGQVVANGTPAEFRRNDNEVVQEFIKSQIPVTQENGYK